MSDMPLQDLHATPRPIASRRTAWLVVIIMTALFLLALVAVIVGFVRQARIVMAGHPAAAVATGAAAVLTLAPGAHIVWAQTEAGKLILHVNLPGGGAEVDIIDLATGKLATRIVTAPVPIQTAPGK